MVRSEMSCVSSVGMYRQVNVFDMRKEVVLEGGGAVVCIEANFVLLRAGVRSCVVCFSIVTLTGHFQRYYCGYKG